MANLLITGGGGYIGRHLCLEFGDLGHTVTVLDNFSRSRETDIPDIPGLSVIRGNVRDFDALTDISRFDGIIHCAGYIDAAESVSAPDLYMQNNYENSVPIIQAAAVSNVPFVFSSSAAVYDPSAVQPLGENSPVRPVNPYGLSKLRVEETLAEYGAGGLRYAALRYFNAAGADPQGRAGEDHQPETHVIPLALQSIEDPGQTFRIFGADYDTTDGTCVRDFVHVSDLSRAHVAAFDHLVDGGANCVLNIGTGIGASVLDVARCVQQVTGIDLNVEYSRRRAGDPPVLVADPTRIKNLLGWDAQITDLSEMVLHSWRYMKSFDSKPDQKG